MNCHDIVSNIVRNTILFYYKRYNGNCRNVCLVAAHFMVDLAVYRKQIQFFECFHQRCIRLMTSNTCQNHISNIEATMEISCHSVLCVEPCQSI